MRELHAVLNLPLIDFTSLKRKSLFFDKFHILEEEEKPWLEDEEYLGQWRNGPIRDALFEGVAHRKIGKNDYEYLSSKGIVATISEEDWNTVCGPNMDKIDKEWQDDKPSDDMATFVPADIRIHNWMVRNYAAELERARNLQTVPLCEFHKFFESPPQIEQPRKSMNEVVKCTLTHLPCPSENVPWEDILNFKYDMKDQLWSLRRFLNDLAIKKQSEAEIRDDIEWTLNEYTKAMKIHRLKSGNSFAEVYVLPIVELAEDLAKFNWSKIAKGVLSVKKRQVELMEAEMKAPGRECAYVFEAQKRFGKRVNR